jgi:hypothetical protein
MSRFSFALTIAVLFAAAVVLSAFALQKLFVSDPDNEDFAEATEETTNEVAERSGSIKSVPGSSGIVMRFDSITYDYASGSTPPGDSLDDKDLGPMLAEVNSEVHRQSTTSTTNDRAASDMVPVYAIKGYDTSFRLAARTDDGLIMFEVLSNPKANEASDVLDIGGKVSSIYIAHWGGPEAGGRLVGGIEDPEKVERVVQGLMDASLKPTRPDYYGTKNPNHYQIYFKLKDGGLVGQNYRMDTGRLSKILSYYRIKTPASGIVAPQSFREAIEEGVKGFLKELEARKAEEQ